MWWTLLIYYSEQKKRQFAFCDNYHTSKTCSVTVWCLRPLVEITFSCNEFTATYKKLCVCVWKWERDRVRGCMWSTCGPFPPICSSSPRSPPFCPPMWINLEQEQTRKRGRGRWGWRSTLPTSHVYSERNTLMGWMIWRMAVTSSGSKSKEIHCTSSQAVLLPSVTFY